MNIAETPELFKHKLYLPIKEVIGVLESQHLIQWGSGFCLAVSDLVQNMLAERGIKSSLAEVQLTITNTNPPNLHVVGLQTTQLIDGEIATHVVVLVDDEEPLLIDCSISHHLPKPFSWVCVPLSKSENDELANCKRGTSTLIYRERKGQQFPLLHQKNIKDRLATDKRFDDAIKQNKTLTRYLIGAVAAIVLLTAYDLGMTWHLNSIANRNYDRIQKIEASDDNLHDRMTSFTKRMNEIDEHLNRHNDRDNILDSRIADIEKLFHKKK